MMNNKNTIQELELEIEKKIIKLNSVNELSYKCGYTVDNENNVTGISFYSCKLDKIPDALSKFKSLKILKFAFNKIADISLLLEFKNIELLDLSFNKQIKNYELLQNFSKLKVLDISYNNLSKIDWIANLKNLKELNISNNSISGLKNISALKELEILDISKNKISNIDVLVSLKKLNELKLHGNNITSIPKELKNFEKKVLRIKTKINYSVLFLDQLFRWSVLWLYQSDMINGWFFWLIQIMVITTLEFIYIYKQKKQKKQKIETIYKIGNKFDKIKFVTDYTTFFYTISAIIIMSSLIMTYKGVVWHSDFFQAWKILAFIVSLIINFLFFLLVLIFGVREDIEEDNLVSLKLKEADIITNFGERHSLPLFEISKSLRAGKNISVSGYNSATVSEAVNKAIIESQAKGKNTTIRGILLQLIEIDKSKLLNTKLNNDIRSLVDKTGAYITESILLGTLSLLAFFTLKIVSSYKSIHYKFSEIFNAIINLDFAALITNNHLTALLSFATLVAAISFILVIAIRIQYIALFKKLNYLVHQAVVFRVEKEKLEKEMSHVTDDKELSNLKAQVVSFENKVNGIVKTAYEILKQIQPIINYMMIFRNLAFFFFYTVLLISGFFFYAYFVFFVIVIVLYKLFYEKLQSFLNFDRIELNMLKHKLKEDDNIEF